MKIFTVLDVKANAFANPFYAQNVGVAIRMLTDTAKNPESMIAMHPGDYQLWLIGEWDDHTGEINVEHENTLIGTIPSLIGEEL